MAADTVRIAGSFPFADTGRSFVADCSFAVVVVFSRAQAAQRSVPETARPLASGTVYSYTLILFRDKKFFPDKSPCSRVFVDYAKIARSGHSVFFAFVINHFQNLENQFLSGSYDCPFPFLISAHII
ncbi:MAG: hypothetical protein K2H40_09155, partial [Lachnospiraceae bacterium]|nr:hypothetical protein [Lachnospiraceae bacterium]